MKNFSVILLAFLVFSCSTSDDKTSTEVVPLAPKELLGSLTNISQATLNWRDNSTNETGFKIERKSGNENYVQIGTVGSEITTYVDDNLHSSTTYTYRVLSYNKVGNSLTYSNQVEIRTPEPITIPTVVTNDISFITISGALGGGNVTSDGGSSIIARGVVWSTSPNPTIELTTKTPNGAGIGGFKCDLGGLKQNTTYYVRAYATNSVGTSYGSQISFTTATEIQSVCDETNSYSTVTIGKQVWMQKNLNVCKYRNGDVIPQVQDPTQWGNLTTGAWCYVQNNTANGIVYGKMYNWYAVNDPRGLAPEGWHIPSDSEWTVLTNYLGGESIAGGKMKTQEYWSLPNTGASNSSGFTALPGGIRENDGSFDTVGYNAVFWSSTEYGSYSAWSRGLNYGASSLDNGDDDKVEGNFVRCIKN